MDKGDVTLLLPRQSDQKYRVWGLQGERGHELDRLARHHAALGRGGAQLGSVGGDRRWGAPVAGMKGPAPATGAPLQYVPGSRS